MRFSSYLLLLAVLFLNACGGNQEKPELQALNNAQALWAQNGSSNYQITVSSSCFCLPSTRSANVVVYDGEINEVYSEEELFLSADDKLYMSVEDLFDLIESTLLMEDSAVTVTYHETFGYPLQVYLDYSIGVADEEDSFALSDYVTHEEERLVMDTNLSLWEANGISDYTANVTISCFCQPMGTLTVTVTQGEVTDVISDLAEPVDANLLSAFPITIDQLFEFLDRHYQSMSTQVTVSYDEALHYPTQVFVDVHPLMVDDTISIQFEVAP